MMTRKFAWPAVLPLAPLMLAGAVPGVPATAQTAASPGQGSPGQVSPAQAAPALTASQAALAARAKALGATEVRTAPAPDGGFVLAGRLEGDQFSVAFPARWNHGAIVFAHGYSMPGSPVAVAEDPLDKVTGAAPLLTAAYQDGYATGHSAYDKAGMGVETASVNTLRLREFLRKLGTRRAIVAGGSMGGNVVMALIEQHPTAFDGAISMCGVTDGWETEFAQLIDMRAAYNVLTEGTPYALPGERDLNRSSFPIDPPAGTASTSDAFRNGKLAQIAMPVVQLFQAAAANPTGREARIIRQVASISGFEPEIASFAFPLITVTLAMDDLKATLGGPVYGNVGKVYASADMTAEEASAFNAKVQRVTADPAAVAAARRWHQTTGRFQVPLVTVHNRIDSLVPYNQSEGLGRIVARAGNDRWLVQYTVPATKAPLPIPGLSGYTHCGFSPEQQVATWAALRGWLDSGKRPAADAVK